MRNGMIIKKKGEQERRKTIIRKSEEKNKGRGSSTYLHLCETCKFIRLYNAS